MLGGGSGISLPAAVVIAMAPSRQMREFEIYWLALALTVAVLGAIVALLRSRHGLALTAIRDNEMAAQSNGIDVTRVKFIVYVLTGFGTAMIGALIFLMKLRISPDTAFSVNDWTAFVIFITVIGGIGRIEGPIIGTIIFFMLRQTLADLGSLYLLMMGAVAIVVMLWAPNGLWGLIAERFGWQALPLQRRLVVADTVEETGRQAMSTIIDIYCHIYPDRFFQEMTQGRAEARATSASGCAASPSCSISTRASRKWTSSATTGRSSRCPIRRSRISPSRTSACKLARIANDSMAELCRKHPERFPAFAAALCLTDVDGSVSRGAPRHQGPRRARRADLHQRRRRAARRAEVRADCSRPWPSSICRSGCIRSRTAAMTDYPAEKKSRYEMWWCFGWPYETSVAMVRMVFCGLLDRYPKLKIITHHLGGMIPYYDGRVGPGLKVLGARTSDEDYSKILPSLKRPHMDYLHDFYADTAMFGGGVPATRCGLEFFGADRVVFATDTPLGPIAPTIKTVKALGLSAADERKLFCGNAEKLLNMKF